MARICAASEVFATLDTVLHNYFLAIDQYFLHGFLMQEWREKALAAERIKHSVEAMRGAYRVAQRILVLGSMPKSNTLSDIRLPYRVSLGTGPLSAVQKDFDLTARMLESLERARDIVQGSADQATNEMFALLVERETQARDGLSAQLEALSAGTASAVDSGEFDAMLDRWSAT